MQEAIDQLKLAASSDTATARYVYVYAIALHSSGDAKQALQVLTAADTRYPNNADILYALVTINKEMGDDKRAQYYDDKLNSLVH